MFGIIKIVELCLLRRIDPRSWRERREKELLRLPQEDCCQALGIPPARKYQSTVICHENGPSAVDILKLLAVSDEPEKDRAGFFKSQMIFWLIDATDGHGKNFSIYLRPGCGFALTPFYDVLSAQPAFDKKQITNNRYKLAMSVGTNRKYRILDISGRHFVETGREAGFGKTQIPPWSKMGGPRRPAPPTRLWHACPRISPATSMTASPVPSRNVCRSSQTRSNNRSSPASRRALWNDVVYADQP